VFTLQWEQARSIAERQRWLVTADQLKQVGVTASEVARAVRSGSVAALLRGVYLCDPDMYDELPPDAWWSAALLAHGDAAMLVACTALRALGVQGLPYDEQELEVAVIGGVSRHSVAAQAPGRLREAPLVVVRQLPVTRDDIVRVGDLRVRCASKSIVDGALRLDRPHQLSVLDSALHLGIIDRPALDEAVAAAAHRRGCVQLRSMSALADARAESPLESRVRLACIDGDVAPDELQYDVQTGPGIVVARGDLAWLKRRRPLLGECDGAGPHSKPKTVIRDRRRGNAVTIEACDTVRFDWSDSCKPSYVCSVVRAALAAA
jgi:hypothetical protein